MTASQAEGTAPAPATGAARFLRDPLVQELCQRIPLEAPWCRSLVLTGSRATMSAPNLSGLQDYDLVAVVPTHETLRALPRLKRLEAELSASYGLTVSLNPVPDLRLRFPGGNYMLLKLGREGVVLHGQDIPSQVRRVRPESIGARWYFFFLASQALRLLRVAPAPSAAPDCPDADVAYQGARAILGCAELLALRSGVYTSEPDALAELLPRLGYRAEAVEVETARQVMSAPHQHQDATRFWWQARGRVLATLDWLFREHRGFPASRRDRLARSFLRLGGRWSPLRDLQFLILARLQGHGFHPRALLDRRNVAERVMLALLWLLEAHSTGPSPETDLLRRTRRLLSGVAQMPPPGEGWPEWQGLRSAARRCFPVACVSLGV